MREDNRVKNPVNKPSLFKTQFEKLESSWSKLWSLKQQCIFVLPPLLEIWWREFGSNYELYLYEFKERSNLIGIAPLYVREGRASFIGSSDVFDYQDFIIAPGYECDFYDFLLDALENEDVKCLDLSLVRPESTVMNMLVDVAKNRGHKVLNNKEDVLLEIELPNTWDGYLGSLSSNHRHNLKRKIRRIHEAGDVNFYMTERSEETSRTMEVFLKLFRESRSDKADFMNEKMERFFRLLVDTMAEINFLKLGVLELDSKPIAIVICFDDKDTIYLYNNSYDTEYSNLSPGLVCKALSIKHSIEIGRNIFNLLKGAETYKYRLAGREAHLYRCQITL